MNKKIVMLVLLASTLSVSVPAVPVHAYDSYPVICNNGSCFYWNQNFWLPLPGIGASVCARMRICAT